MAYKFGPWDVAADEVFYTSALSFAFVNLKPLVPGEYAETSVIVVHSVNGLIVPP